MRLAAALLLALPSLAAAAPISPVGADASGAGLRTGSVAVYAAVALPGGGVGADVGLGPLTAGAELGLVDPGVLRPEVHLRVPVALGPVALAPHLALAWDRPLRRFAGNVPLDTTADAILGFALRWPRGRVAPFADLGALTVSTFTKQQTRFYGTAALGAAFAVTPQLSVAAHAGLLYTRYDVAPGAGLTFSWTVNP